MGSILSRNEPSDESGTIHVKPRVQLGHFRPTDQASMILVASGKGIFLSPSSPLSDTPRASGVVAIPLNSPYATIPVGMMWRKDETSRIVLAFLECAREVFRISGARADVRHAEPV